MSTVTIVLYNALIPVGAPGAAGVSLMRRMSWAKSIRERITLSAVEIEKYGLLNLETSAFHRLLLGPETWWINNKMPAPVPTVSTQTVVVGLWRTQLRTESAEEGEAGEGDDPEVPSVGDVATIDLEGPVLDVWTSESSIKPKSVPKSLPPTNHRRGT